jgi:citrate lyase subunit beta / citryl-CoA lyase
MVSQMVDVAEVGHKGEDIKSDCWVRLELTSSGGLVIEQTSKVNVMYGKQNEALIKEVLGALGVDNAKISLIDTGAVPFVISARIEAAVKKLRPETKQEFLPEMDKRCLYGTTKDRSRRSRLYIPGDQPKFMLNAGIYKPDAVILDLEDAVAPPMKEDTRFVVRNALRKVDFMGCERMVRINQGEMGLLDLEYIVPHNVHVILIPKCESANQVKMVDARCKALLAQRGDGKGGQGPVYLMPILESGLGIVKAYEIASATDTVCALGIGLEDYTADLGTQRTNEGKESFYARSALVNAARAAGVQAIDSVFSDVQDMEGLMASCLEAKALGFDGKGCIHPRQIKIIHDAFAPQTAEIEKAKRIVLAFDQAQKEGKGVVSLGTKMIDPPVVKRAIKTVNMAMSMGLLKKDWKEKP